MHTAVSQEEIDERMENMKFRLAIMSGKGGVGKSTTTALLAVHYARKGNKVGILDADFLGPSIPHLFGLEGERVILTKEGIWPVTTKKYGIKIMSLQFLLPEKNAPVIWRGPLIASVLREFLARVNWGELDYFLVDLPPGTGDAPLTIMKDAKPNGVVVVSTPQELTSMIVEKAINMAKSVDTKVLGIIENMSYYLCPNCGHKSFIFGKGKVKDLAKKYGIGYYVELPLDQELLKLADSGKIEMYEKDWFENVPF